MQFIPIGKTGRPHGLKGELKVNVEDTYEDDFLEAESVIIELSGQPVPYFVEYIRGGGALILKIEEVDTREQAQLLSDRPLLLREADVQTVAPGPAHPYLQLAGYRLHDATAGDLGTIEEVVELPQQMMAVIHLGAAERMIPLHEDFVVRIDDKGLTVYVELPDGLLTL